MFYLIIIGAYASLIALVVLLLHKLGLGLPWKIIAVTILLLAPFWDIFVSKAIMWNYSRHNNPLQVIDRTISSPESVLWIDNVWPGHDEYSRYHMVASYLDGIHLKTLAIKGEDAQIYLYRATKDDFAESEKIQPQHEKLSLKIERLEKEAKTVGRNGGDNKKLWKVIRQIHEPEIKQLGYKKIREKEIRKIFANPIIYKNVNEIPLTNYHVTFNRNCLPEWQEKFVWCDEVTIFDNIKNEKIAFSKRCMGYSPMTGVNPVSSSPKSFYGGSRLGDERAYSFDDKVLFHYVSGNVADGNRNWEFEGR